MTQSILEERQGFRRISLKIENARNVRLLLYTGENNQNKGTDLWDSGERLIEGVQALKRLESRAQKGVWAPCRIRNTSSVENERYG